jgi:hypothetical protein
MYFFYEKKGLAKELSASFRQQAGHQELDDLGGDLAGAQSDIDQGPRVAHTGVLCTDGRRPLPRSRMDCLEYQKEIGRHKSHLDLTHTKRNPRNEIYFRMKNPLFFTRDDSVILDVVYYFNFLRLFFSFNIYTSLDDFLFV